MFRLVKNINTKLNVFIICLCVQKNTNATASGKKQNEFAAFCWVNSISINKNKRLNLYKYRQVTKFKNWYFLLVFAVNQSGNCQVEKQHSKFSIFTLNKYSSCYKEATIAKDEDN